MLPGSPLQCRFSALIYSFKTCTFSSVDLVEIMNIGNRLYITPSGSTRETFLLLTDLPAMVNLFDTNFELRYSESYSGVINGQSVTLLTTDPYIMSLDAASNSCIMSDTKY